MQAQTAIDHLINFVMQISHGVYLTAPFVKNRFNIDLSRAFKEDALPALASKGPGVSKLIFQTPEKRKKHTHRKQNNNINLPTICLFNWPRSREALLKVPVNCAWQFKSPQCQPFG